MGSLTSSMEETEPLTVREQQQKPKVAALVVADAVVAAVRGGAIAVGVESESRAAVAVVAAEGPQSGDGGRTALSKASPPLMATVRSLRRMEGLGEAGAIGATTLIAARTSPAENAPAAAAAETADGTRNSLGMETPLSRLGSLESSWQSQVGPALSSPLVGLYYTNSPRSTSDQSIAGGGGGAGAGNGRGAGGSNSGFEDIHHHHRAAAAVAAAMSTGGMWGETDTAVDSSNSSTEFTYSPTPPTEPPPRRSSRSGPGSPGSNEQPVLPLASNFSDQGREAMARSSSFASSRRDAECLSSRGGETRSGPGQQHREEEAGQEETVRLLGNEAMTLPEGSFPSVAPAAEDGSL